MDITIKPVSPQGTLKAISSKSAAHRVLICAAFANGATRIRCDKTNKDIEATAKCLCSLGADIRYEAPYFYVKPIERPISGAMLECGESGSTLRFLLPIIPAIGVDASFELEGRLPQRPLSPLYEELLAHGVKISPQGSNPLTVSGQLSGEPYRIRGDVSSQFISGLLFAMTFGKKGGRLIIEGKTESAPYVDMTADALSAFGAVPQKTEDGYIIEPNSTLVAPEYVEVEGDWSNAAFPLCMGAMGDGKITVTGLSASSRQGDKAIIELLGRFGADIDIKDGAYTVRGGRRLKAIDIDASQIPDLVPVLATVASVCDGTTKIYGASRLRLKESDRLMAVTSMLTALGADVTETDDGLIIKGVKRLSGGTTDSFNDHRIAMSAAVASVACEGAVTVKSADCVAKSYPDFWRDVKSLGL